MKPPSLLLRGLAAGEDGRLKLQGESAPRFDLSASSKSEMAGAGGLVTGYNGHMHLLLIAENWPPRIGGIENYLTNIATHLPPQTVTVVAPRAGTIPEISGGGIRKTIRVKFFWLLVRPAWLPLFIKMYRHAKREKIDVVLCGKALFEGLIGYYLKKHLGIPYVVFTYAMEIDTWRSLPRQQQKLRRVLQTADAVVYINDHTKRQLKDLGVTEHQLVKIWPGIADRYFKSVPPNELSETLQRYNLVSPYIISVGRLVPRKGFDQLINAFAKLDQTKFPEIKLVIVGDGPEKKSLEALARQEFIQNSVLFLGHVPDADLPALYQGSLFLALTPHAHGSELEGFGIVYTEAAASGRTSLATNSGGVREAVLHNETGLVVEQDPPAIQAALTYLLEHPEHREKLAAAALARAHTQFKWTARIALVQAMLDALLKKE